MIFLYRFYHQSNIVPAHQLETYLKHPGYQLPVHTFWFNDRHTVHTFGSEGGGRHSFADKLFNNFNCQKTNQTHCGLLPYWVQKLRVQDRALSK